MVVMEFREKESNLLYGIVAGCFASPLGWLAGALGFFGPFDGAFGVSYCLCLGVCTGFLFTYINKFIGVV